MKYSDEARSIWLTYVPPQGRADTVQGELLRAAEKLRDEALRNGNVNWSKDHEALGDFLYQTLTSCETFTPSTIAEIQRTIQRVLDVEYPADDDLYDGLADRIVEWCRAHPFPLRRYSLT